ncbi:MAG: hypothetical protein M1292_00755 [Bacteroidetes bacterium]|nr:hypothetical protein [Bacteroidota bacterium]
MKLKQVFAASSASKAKIAPTVSINYFNGRMRFNAPTVVLLDLKESDKLAFYQDEESPRDWYFMKSKGVGSLPLKVTQNSKALCVNNAKLVRPMLQSMGISTPTQFLIGEELVEGLYWKILSDKIVK